MSETLHRNGLVIGKFMPFHLGHEALIRFALTKAERVTVLVGALANEPIPGPVRYGWVKTHFQNEPRLTIEYTDEPLPTAPQADSEVSRVWAGYLQARFPQTDLFVSSEAYGRLVAQFMRVDWCDYDLDRGRLPISGTAIRQDPVAHWRYLPAVVRPWFVQTVCLIGPESTGKTVMAERLARHYDTAWVAETARAMIDQAGDITADLIRRVPEAHATAIQQGRERARGWLFVDSDLITTRVYFRHFFGQELTVSDWVEAENRFDHFFLFSPDVPFVMDPQRIGDETRPEFFRVFRQELDHRGLPYTVVTGDWDQRFQIITDKLVEIRELRYGRKSETPWN